MSDTVVENSTERGIAWATLLYPESMEKDYKKILEESCVPCFLSPLHDSDTDEDGVLKKPHYHLLVWFHSSRRKSQVEKLRIKLNGVGLERVESAVGYARYLCHLDDPDKVQYDTRQVQSFGGRNYMAVLANSVERYEATNMLTNMALQVSNFADLVRLVLAEKPELLIRLSERAYYYNTIIQNNQAKLEQEPKKIEKKEEPKNESKTCREKMDGVSNEGWAADSRHESPFHISDGEPGGRIRSGKGVHLEQTGRLDTGGEIGTDRKRGRDKLQQVREN